MKNHRKGKVDYSTVKVTLKLFKKNGVASTYLTGTKTRFISKLSAQTWVKCLIKVEYGKHEDVFGNIVLFTNEGEYTNSKEAIHAFRAFIEV